MKMGAAAPIFVLQGGDLDGNAHVPQATGLARIVKKAPTAPFLLLIERQDNHVANAFSNN